MTGLYPLSKINSSLPCYEWWIAFRVLYPYGVLMLSLGLIDELAAESWYCCCYCYCTPYSMLVLTSSSMHLSRTLGFGCQILVPAKTPQTENSAGVKSHHFPSVIPEIPRSYLHTSRCRRLLWESNHHDQPPSRISPACRTLAHTSTHNVQS